MLAGDWVYGFSLWHPLLACVSLSCFGILNIKLGYARVRACACVRACGVRFSFCVLSLSLSLSVLSCSYLVGKAVLALKRLHVRRLVPLVHHHALRRLRRVRGIRVVQTVYKEGGVRGVR